MFPSDMVYTGVDFSVLHWSCAADPFNSIASNLRRDFRSRVEKPAVALQAKSFPGWDFVIGSGAGFELDPALAEEPWHRLPALAT